MAGPPVKIEGLREFQRALVKADKETRKELRAAFREAAEPVRKEAASLFSRIDAGSAAGYRIAVRKRGVSIEQRRKRVTGKRGDYGSLQMKRALIPALKNREDEVVGEFKKAAERITDIVKRSSLG